MEDEELLDVVDEEIETEPTHEEMLEDSEEDSEDITETDSEEEVSQDDEEVVEDEEAKKSELQEEQKKIDRIVEDRLKRERRKNDRENAQLKQIATIMQKQLGAKTPEEALKQLVDYYNIPQEEYENNSYSEREQRILAEADANEIKSLGIQEMIAEANRISSIPKEKRTQRDNYVFNSLAEEITAEQEKVELQKIGGKEKIYNSSEFKEFRKQFNYNTPINVVYEMFTKLNPVQETKPASAGSASSKSTKQKYKDFYTQEEVSKFTEKDLDDPKLMAIVEDSMSKWKY